MANQCSITASIVLVVKKEKNKITTKKQRKTKEKINK